MPTVRFFGVPVRVRAMLDAIGAQETLEMLGSQRMGRVMVSPSQERAHERLRLATARRRNAAEARLRPEEHAAWNRWRAANAGERAAGYAVLTDLSHG